MPNFNFEKQVADIMQRTTFTNESYSKLSSILKELKTFVNTTPFSKHKFRQKVISMFDGFDFKHLSEFTNSSSQMLLNFSSTKQDALRTINDLENTINVINYQVRYNNAVKNMAKDFMDTLEKEALK